MYNSSLKAKIDYENTISFAEEKAFEKGRHEEALEIARNLKNKKIDIYIISDTTGLSIQEIEKL
ncbi:hypothetical protein LPB86_15895 [Pedobacter sp. MC2016-14]|uniref:hypothetical protein n=1 Tax=Pedobacter sp. MC2016-14 TaxID=2897327 RepID=UPI001E64E505|nr:hypothetical protein [Pedobacter sp. MC2016-14]MCD0489725.1 hypothetical protein [Pedobacter sp. MC2016-14]